MFYLDCFFHLTSQTADRSNGCSFEFRYFHRTVEHTLQQHTNNTNNINIVGGLLHRIIHSLNKKIPTTPSLKSQKWTSHQRKYRRFGMQIMQPCDVCDVMWLVTVDYLKGGKEQSSDLRLLCCYRKFSHSKNKITVKLSHLDESSVFINFYWCSNQLQFFYYLYTFVKI